MENCLFCQSDFRPPPEIRNFRLDSQDDILTQGKLSYIDAHYHDFDKRIIKVPETRFYNHGRTIDCPEPDLVGDQSLNAPQGTVRNRQTASDEEMVARYFLH